MLRKNLIPCLFLSLFFLRSLCFPSNEIVVSDEKYVDPLESQEREVLERIKEFIFDDGFRNRPTRIGRGEKMIFWGLDNSIVKGSPNHYRYSLKRARFIIFAKDLATGKETKFILPGLGFRKTEPGSRWYRSEYGTKRTSVIVETGPWLCSSQDGSKVAYVPIDSENKVRILLTDNFELFDIDNPCEGIVKMVWSVGGDRLALIGRDTIYIFDMNSQETIKVYSGGDFTPLTYFHWIGDSEVLFLERDCVYKLKIGKKLQLIFQLSGEASDFDVYPSADGSKIIVRWEKFGFPSKSEVWLINSKGEIVEELAVFQKPPSGGREYEWGWFNILWAPEGKKFVYSPRIMRPDSSGCYSGGPGTLRLRVLEKEKDIKLLDGEVRPIKWLDNNRLIYQRNGEKRLLTLKEH